MVRGCAIFSAIWTAVQAVAYIVVASLGYNTFFTGADLQWDVSDPIGIFSYVLNLLYFFNEKYDETLEMELSDIDSSFNAAWGLKLTYSKTPETAVRTNDWMLAYIVLSSLWLATSVLLFIGTVMDSTGKMLAITVVPWVLVAAANIVADVVATATFAQDIADTTTLQKLVHLLGINLPKLPDDITLPPDTPGITEQFDKIEVFGTWFPALVMVVFFSRVVIIFFINVFLLFYVPIEAKKRNNRVQPKPLNVPPHQPQPLQQPQQYPQQYPQQHQQHSQQAQQPPFAPWSPRDPQTRSPLQPLAVETLPNGYGSAPQNSYGNKPSNATQNGFGNTQQNEYGNRQQNGLQNGYANKPPPTAPRPMSVDRLNQYDPPAPMRKLDNHGYSHDATTESWLAGHKGSPAGNGNGSGSGNGSGNGNGGNSGNGNSYSSHSNPSPKPVVTEPVSVLKKEKPDRDINPGPDELRNQLPWSYFNNRREAPRPVARRELDGDLPPMPPPDYTLRFKQARRTEVGRTNN